MLRTAEKTAFILSELYEETFSSDSYDPFRITWADLRGIAGVARLNDRYLNEIYQALNDTGYTLIAFYNFLVVARENDMAHFRLVPPRVVEEFLYDDEEDDDFDDKDEDDLENMFEFDEIIEQRTRIAVIAVGGGGINAVGSMISNNIRHVEFILADTDASFLLRTRAKTKIQIGIRRTKGCGTGNSPDIGREAAMESRSQLVELLNGVDLLFIIAGMGGRTGTGAAPVIAKTAREAGILTVGIVTKPFTYEGRVRAEIAERGIDEFKEYADSLIVIGNDHLITPANKIRSLFDAFKPSDDALYHAVRGISELITLRVLNYADVRTIMRIRGIAKMGLGTGNGVDKASTAINMAFSSLMLEGNDISKFKGVLVNITGPSSMTMDDYDTVNRFVHERVYEEASIIIGVVLDDSIGDVIKVIVITTGFMLPHLVVRHINQCIKIENILDIPHIDTVLTICAHPQKCIVCSFDFEKYFGGRWPPYKLKYEGKEYDNDARPVCPNCHATLYRSW